VPWDWCTSEKTISANNSIVMFEAHDRSLHAVKLRYDHTRFQRTQIYGNLWHTDVALHRPAIEYGGFDLRPRPTLLEKYPVLKFARTKLSVAWRGVRNR
jgi:hypothetical protein